MDLVHKISIVKARPASYWVNSANQHLPVASSVVLVIMLAWYLSRFIWVLLPQQGEFDWSIRVPAASGPVGQMTSATRTDFGAIAAAHLFGIPGAEPVIETTVDAPETRLDLKLRGTIAADDPSMAHAIIADGKGKDKVYFIKDKVPGGAVLPRRTGPVRTPQDEIVERTHSTAIDLCLSIVAELAGELSSVAIVAVFDLGDFR